MDVPLAFTGQVQKAEPVHLLQIALKNNVGVFYFQTTVTLHALFAESVVDQQTFMSTFQDTACPSTSFSVTAGTMENVQQRLAVANVALLHQAGPTVRQTFY